MLDGNIVRGRTETIRAVIWYSDLHSARAIQAFPTAAQASATCGVSRLRSATSPAPNPSSRSVSQEEDAVELAEHGPSAQRLAEREVVPAAERREVAQDWELGDARPVDAPAQALLAVRDEVAGRAPQLQLVRRRAVGPTLEGLSGDALAADPADQPDVIGRVQKLRAQAAAQDGKTLGHQVLAQRAEQLVVAAAVQSAGDQPLDGTRMLPEQVVRLLSDVASACDVVGLAITEHTPWDTLAMRNMLRQLPLMSS